MELKGNFTQKSSDGDEHEFAATGTHKVILSGTEEQIVSFKNADSSGFNILESKNENVKFNTYARITKIDKNSVFNTLYISNTTFADGIEVKVKEKLYCRNTNSIKSAKVSVNGNAYIYGNVSIDTGTLNINGNLTQDGADYSDVINVGSGTLKVGGDYYAKEGTFNAGSGRTEIGGSFLAEKYVSSVAYSFTNFKMQDNSAYMLVNGDFVIDTNKCNTNYISAGTLELKGDFTQKNSTSDEHDFTATGTHKVILSGTGEQIIVFQNPNSSYFNQTINNNPNGVKFLTWSEYLKWVENGGNSDLKFTVTFDTIVDGKTTTTVNANSYLTNLPTPTHTGLKFAAWYKDKDYKNLWVGNVDKVTSDITLYARWTKDSSDRSDIYDPYSVSLSTHKNWLIFPDYEMPLIPKNKTSEYASELYEWAKEFGYDDIITEEAAKEIVEKYMPTTYRVGDEYVRDNEYDTKAVMRDIIMLNSTKKSIYNWEDEFLVPNYSTKATDINKRAMKILEGYADYCDSADRNPVTNALYTVATTAYTKGAGYVKGKLKSTGYNTIQDYFNRVDSLDGLAFGVPTTFWNDVKLTYNTYRYDSLSFDDSAWKDLAISSTLDMTKSIAKSEMNAFVADALSMNDSTAQMHTLYTKLQSIGGFVGDGFSSAIAPYKLAYELLEYTVDAGQNVNEAFIFLTQYHFINRYPELCGIMFNENGKICRDVVTLNMEVLPKLDDDDYIGKVLVNRLLTWGIKDSLLFSIDDETNFAMMQSAVTMNLIDGLNVNALRKDLVEYWASVYSGEPVTKTNLYIPSGSSCTVSESVALMSLSDNGYVATLDENGEFETTSENVSVIGRTDDAIIVEVIGDYNIQLSNATDNVLISQTTENAGDITNNIVSLYEANTMMNISTVGEEFFVTAIDNTGEEKVADPIATLDDTANKLLADADALTITFDAGDSADSVKNNLILSDVGGYGSEISWKSSNTSVITDGGEVIRCNTDQTVTMTATLTLNNQDISKSFDVVVKANTVYITVDDCVVEDNSVDVNAYAVNELSTDKDGVVIIALYNQNRLVGTHMQEVSTTSQTSANVKYEFLNCDFSETDTPEIKVFWWTDFEKLVPICNAVSKEVQ